MWGCLCLKVKRLHIISFQIIEHANSKPCLHVNQHEIPLAGGCQPDWVGYRIGCGSLPRLCRLLPPPPITHCHVLLHRPCTPAAAGCECLARARCGAHPAVYLSYLPAEPPCSSAPTRVGCLVCCPCHDLVACGRQGCYVTFGVAYLSLIGLSDWLACGCLV